jgi:hypothetical protein
MTRFSVEPAATTRSVEAAAPRMRSLRDLKGASLAWEQPRAMRSEYELRSSSDLFATLRVTDFGRRTSAESADASWTIRRLGLFRQSCEVRDARSAGLIATFKGNWLGRGSLAFTDGQCLRWRVASFWWTRWQFEREDGTPVVRLSSRSALFRARASVEIEPGAEARAETMPLLVLGWYLLLTMRRSHAQ